MASDAHQGRAQGGDQAPLAAIARVSAAKSETWILVLCFLRHGGFPPKTSSQTAHNARFLEGQPREWNPYKKIMPL